MHDSREKKPNALIHESSPYLLQHAYNPVEWVPFSPAAFETAKRESKPLLISIGYSACHWCHVMEHESFEDPEVAALMNANFVNVKVDREERPDVDMLHMEAVQLMTGQGGWPLNCFVLPDGRPFYGGTYFPKKTWLNILNALSGLYTNERDKVERYAQELTEGIKQAESIISRPREGEQQAVDANLLRQCVSKWKRRIDRVEGGPDKAPKFPLPSNYQFLLRYALLEKDVELLDHVKLTLTKMAFGGIYDQVHGGFARYSTDAMWKVPHFEKMLYDNAQLAALYTEAWLHTRNGLYREIAMETLDFVQREWYRAPGYFYSAYDADSEGAEGRYYVWSKEELREILGEDYDLFSAYYEINEKGYWEDGNYILMRSADTSGLQARSGLDARGLRGRMNDCRHKLREAAGKRVKPGLDDKSVTAWNAMMCSACARAWLAFGEARYRDMALASVRFMLGTLRRDDHSLFRSYKNGKAKINGFLDDYAFAIQACMDCYLVTQDESYLAEGRRLCEFALGNFENDGSLLLYYTGKDAEALVARTTETSDNVIPASNSQMALNLFCLGHYFGNEGWVGRAEKMLAMVAPELLNYGAGYSNWGCLALHLSYSFKEVALVGNHVDEKLRALYSHGITNAILACSPGESGLPLLRDRHVEGKTMIYVCENRSCKLPVETVEEALKQIE